MSATKQPRRCDVPRRPPDGKVLIGLAEAAYLLDVAVPTVKRLLAAAKIPSVGLPGVRRRLFSREAIEAWVRKGCPRPARK